MQGAPLGKQPTDLSEFKPAWWLRNCHLQTILAKYLAPKRTLPLTAERFSLADGDELMLNWTVAPSQIMADQPIVMILHGLEGNFRSHYVRGLMHSLQQQGWAAVLMHFRGCHGETNKLARAYHSGDTVDFHAVLSALQQRFPNQPFAAVGFSLGGNVLMKYCGEQAEHNPLRAAVAVSAPLMLAASAERINQGFSRIYQRYLLGRLKRTIRQKIAQLPHFPQSISSHQLNRIRSIRQFDEMLTAPLHGFINAEDYYRQASAKPYLAAIRRPCLLIHAKDDPFLASNVIPTPAELSPWVRLLLSEQGGHVGFIGGGTPWQPHYWLDQVIPKFLTPYLTPDCELTTVRSNVAC